MIFSHENEQLAAIVPVRGARSPQKMKKPILRMLREAATTPSAMTQLNVQLG